MKSLILCLLMLLPCSVEANTPQTYPTNLACLTINHELGLQRYFAITNINPDLIKHSMRKLDGDDKTPVLIVPPYTICMLSTVKDKT